MADTSERCDLCNAQAYVRVIISFAKSELMFCKHHYETYESALMEEALMIIDKRAELDVKLDASA